MTAETAAKHFGGRLDIARAPACRPRHLRPPARRDAADDRDAQAAAGTVLETVRSRPGGATLFWMPFEPDHVLLGSSSTRMSAAISPRPASYWERLGRQQLRPREEDRQGVPLQPRAAPGLPARRARERRKRGVPARDGHERRVSQARDRPVLRRAGDMRAERVPATTAARSCATRGAPRAASTRPTSPTARPARSTPRSPRTTPTSAARPTRPSRTRQPPGGREPRRMGASPRSPTTTTARSSN